MSHLRLKCTKFDFVWGSAPDPAGGAHNALPDPQLDSGGPTSKGRGRGGEGGREGRKEEERGRGGRGKGGRRGSGKWRVAS